LILISEGVKEVVSYRTGLHNNGVMYQFMSLM